MTDYSEMKKDLQESVNLAVIKAMFDDEREVDSITIKMRYSALMAAVDMFIDFAKAWDATDDDDEKYSIVQDYSLSLVSFTELISALSAVKGDKDAYEKAIAKEFNSLDAVVCELDMDMAKIAAEMLGMTYDELIEKHWDKHIRCNDNGDLELCDEAD